MVTTGDEITIRILPAGDYDEPHGMTGNSKNSVDDRDFGKLNYYVDAWDADFPLDSVPIESAHIHIRSDDSGPSKQQRERILELRVRHSQLWPEICSALANPLLEIKTSDEMSSRLVPHVGIDLYVDSHIIAITYRAEGDPQYLAYDVTLRDGQITEDCIAE